MRKGKPTLFEQYQAARQKQEPLWHTATHIRWIAVTVSVLVSALCMPSIARFLLGMPGISIPAVGFRWNDKPIVAEQSFAVFKPEELYHQECDSVRMSTSPVYQLSTLQPLEQSQFAPLFEQLELKVFPKEHSLLRVRFLRWLDSTIANKVIVDSIVTTLAPYVLLKQGTANYRRIGREQLMTHAQLEQLVRSWARTHNLSDTLLPVLITSAVHIPTATYSAFETMQEQQTAVQSVRRTLGIVRRGEVIVAPGDIITPITVAKLISYRQAILSADRWTSHGSRSIITSIIRAFLLSSIVWLYLMFVRADRFYDNRVVITIAVLLSLSALQSFLTTLIPSAVAPEFLVLLPAMAMLVTVLYDVRLAFAFAMSATLLHVAIRSSDLMSGLALLIASLAGAVSVQNLRSRYQFIRSVLLIMLGFALALIIAVLENELMPTHLAAPLLAATINAGVSPLALYGILWVVDRVFDVQTDLRLLELDSLSHPLLVKMRQLAPGTYQHTLNVAILAEHAALAIGANPLLARVGAYFHDIGKIRKPEYFAENQIEFANKHRELSPKQSAAIIRSHVEDGVELAIEYNLPPKIIEFIPAHHGTSLIRHFYALACDEASTTSQQVDEEDFRYPGPKPRTKETAIVMLADVAEAVSRLADSRSDIEKRLEDVFREKISDGQLDECPLSLNEVATIRQLFGDLLAGMLHQRPEYKSLDTLST